MMFLFAFYQSKDMGTTWFRIFGRGLCVIDSDVQMFPFSAREKLTQCFFVGPGRRFCVKYLPKGRP